MASGLFDGAFHSTIDSEHNSVIAIELAPLVRYPQHISLCGGNFAHPQKIFAQSGGLPLVNRLHKRRKISASVINAETTNQTLKGVL